MFHDLFAAAPFFAGRASPRCAPLFFSAEWLGARRGVGWRALRGPTLPGVKDCRRRHSREGAGEGDALCAYSVAALESHLARLAGGSPPDIALRNARGGGGGFKSQGKQQVKRFARMIEGRKREGKGKERETSKEKPWGGGGNDSFSSTHPSRRLSRPPLHRFRHITGRCLPRKGAAPSRPRMCCDVDKKD
jgi:hypothetical protein